MNILTHRFLQTDSYKTFMKEGIVDERDFSSPIFAASYYYEWYYSYIKKMLSPVQRILEIGVFKGYSAATFAIASEECGYNISYLGLDNASYGIDPIQRLNQIEILFPQHKFEALILDTQNISQLPNQIYGEYEIIHIDGAHNADGSAELHDFNLVFKHLSDNGVIIIDDLWHTRYSISSLIETFRPIAEQNGLVMTIAPSMRGHLLITKKNLDEIFKHMGEIAYYHIYETR